MVHLKAISNACGKEGGFKNPLVPNTIVNSGINMNRRNMQNWHSSAVAEVCRLAPIAEVNIENSPPEQIKIITMRDVQKQPEN